MGSRLKAGPYGCRLFRWFAIEAHPRMRILHAHTCFWLRYACIHNFITYNVVPAMWSYTLLYVGILWQMSVAHALRCAKLEQISPPVAVRVSDLSLHLYLYPYTDISRHTYVPR